jgi:hypothetical protein
MSVYVVLGDIPTRIVVGYGPQENDAIEKKRNFWSFIENEITEAEINSQGIMIQMDVNLHAGNLVDKDPNPKHKNGKLFMDFLSRNKSLTVLNCLDTCKGVITRRRVFENKIEEAVLDFFLVNEKLRVFFREMLINEDRLFGLCNTAQIKKNGRIIESDHNSMIAEFDIEINRKKNLPERKCSISEIGIVKSHSKMLLK